VDIKLLNELLQLLRKQTLSSGVQPRKQEKRRRSKREPRVGFNLLIPHRLYVQLKNYVDLYADRGESITEIILTGLEKELKKKDMLKKFFLKRNKLIPEVEIIKELHLIRSIASQRKRLYNILIL